MKVRGLNSGFVAALLALASAQAAEMKSAMPVSEALGCKHKEAPSDLAVGMTEGREFVAPDGGVFRYRWHQPRVFEPGRTYPMLVFLHGASARGSDNRAQLAMTLPLLTDCRRRFGGDFFFLAGQVPTERRWVEVEWTDLAHKMPKTPSETMGRQIAFLEKAFAEFPIDRSRVYVTGHSMGGFGTWDLAARKPEWFAAAMPLCGGGDVRTSVRFRDLPVWAFHGERDTTVPVVRSRNMVKAIWEEGGNAKYTELPQVAHNCWTRAYADKTALDWLYAQRRPRFEAVSPANGATVALLNGRQKAFLDMDDAERAALFDTPAFRSRTISSCGEFPNEVTLGWPCERYGRVSVALYRERDGVCVRSWETDGNCVTVGNLERGCGYRWTLTRPDAVVTNRFVTESRGPRLLRVPGLTNVRDIGGSVGIGGRRIRQGMLFRSAGLNENALLSRITNGTDVVRAEVPGKSHVDGRTFDVMVREFGIRTDIDLRNANECSGMVRSPLGSTVEWIEVSSACYQDMTNDWAKAAFAKVFRLLTDPARYPAVFHCIGGQDRTGSLAYVLEALLGVGEEELVRDWEVTAFRNSECGWFTHRRCYDRLLDMLATFPGVTPESRCLAYVRSCGVTDAEVERFRAIMLEQPVPLPGQGVAECRLAKEE